MILEEYEREKVVYTFTGISWPDSRFVLKKGFKQYDNEEACTKKKENKWNKKKYAF